MQIVCWSNLKVLMRFLQEPQERCAATSGVDIVAEGAEEDAGAEVEVGVDISKQEESGRQRIKHAERTSGPLGEQNESDSEQLMVSQLSNQ